MTTKKGRRANTTTNGKANGRRAPSHDAKSSAQTPPDPAAQISDADRMKLKAWLDRAEKPFSVVITPASRKRKRDTPSMQVQDDLWEERLSVQYEVRPKDKWESLRRYKKFTVGSESIATGQCILVKYDDAEDAKIDLHNQWKAKVLEVRALDQEHVYIRVAWLNRPEDLDAGRKDYHGRNELIPTNQLDIIDAMAVNGSFDLVHWTDTEDDTAVLQEDQFFWRQTYDYANSRTFSKLRLICTDNKPQNPDEMILQCSNENCRKWMHVKCIAEQAVQRAVDEASGNNKKSKAAAAASAILPPRRARPKTLDATTSPSAVATAALDSFTADLFIKSLPAAATAASSSPDGSPDEKKVASETEIVFTDGLGEQYAEDMCCLHCGKAIED